MSADQSPGLETRPGTLLHVGCGHERAPDWLAAHGLREVRLDIDPSCEPDIVASMADLGDIGKFDVVYSSHSLEHLVPHEADKALSEFRRVLTATGVVLVVVPDLEDIRPTEDVVYESPAGPISGLDMYFGLRSALPTMPYMAHRTGFVRATLQSAFERAGFGTVVVERLPGFNLMAAGRK